MDSDFNVTLRMLFNFFVPLVPYCIAWLIGMVLCLVRWRRHPIASLLAMVAFGIFLVGAILGTLAQVWVFQQGIGGDWDHTEREMVMWAVTFLRSGSGFVGWVLLLIAFFGWRPAPRAIGGNDEGEAAPSDAAIRRWGD
jgi:hypothetical protein